MPESKTFSLPVLVAGGCIFGLYFSLGLAWFETFAFPEGKAWLSYIPVLMILSGVCTWLAVFLWGPKTHSRIKSNDFIRLGGVPLLSFAIAGLLLAGYGGWMEGTGFSSDLIQRIGFHLLLVGLLPVVAVLVWLQGNGRRPHPDSAPNQEAVREDQSNKNPSWKVEGIYQSHFSAGQLVLVEAANNYCKIWFLEGDSLKSDLIRAKMKDLEDSLQGETDFFRCHRSYLVNARYVRDIKGSSQAYRLEMAHFGEQVPVSRSFEVEELKKAAGLK
ncbi:MAG: LytTR family transcriptional regulator [Bacteroidia bacterium]|nr:LytTR family transcriptional regulator [Bacteroidia bacterium]